MPGSLRDDTEASELEGRGDAAGHAHDSDKNPAVVCEFVFLAARAK